MLDNDTLEADPGKDLIEGEAPPEEGEPELAITIEGEEPDADPDAEIEAELGDRGKRALQALRKVAKEATAKARAAEAELAARDAIRVVDEPVLERPTIEGCGYNTEIYDQKLRDFFTAEAKAEEKKQARIAEAKAADEDYQTRLGGYVAGKTALRAADMDAAESVVRSKLTVEQQNVLIRNSDNPAQVVLALGRSKKALDDLASVKDIDRFAYSLAKLEGKITVTTKAPPPPESKLRGGGPAVNIFPKLDKLKEQAQKSGDYTAYLAAKREAQG